MREIKFRAWDRVQNVMRGWDWLEEKQGTYLNSKYFHAMQYTGFKDKNGKEIYEGDIVRELQGGLSGDKVRERVIEWDGGGFSFYLLSDTEVIGNIHENPELIKTI